MLFILIGLVGLAGAIITVILFQKTKNVSEIFFATFASCIFTFCIFFAVVAPLTMVSKANGLPKDAMLIEVKLDNIDTLPQREKAELFNKIVDYNEAVREGKANADNIWFGIGYPRDVFDNLETFDNVDVIIKK